jgi:hypothetical protein
VSDHRRNQRHRQGYASDFGGTRLYGCYRTNLLVDNENFGPDLMARLKAQMRTPAEGAATPVYLATAPEAADIRGAFFLSSRGHETIPLHIPWDHETAVRLRDVSLKMVGSRLQMPAS